MRLENDDDSVGIGTQYPSTKLDVISSGTSIRESTDGGFGFAGVLGMSGEGTGVYGFSANGAGVQGYSATGYGGFFEGPISYFSKDVGIGTMTPDNPLEIVGIGTTIGGNVGYGEVVARLGNANSSQHTAFSIDAASGKDAIAYWAQNGSAFWSARNDVSRGSNWELRYHGGNAIGRVAVTVDSLGWVGIGDYTPDHLLDVDGNAGVNGDLEVTGAYKGSIPSSTGSDGAPFPRPAYNSGWVDIGLSELLVLDHNIGGDIDNYVVDLQFYDQFGMGINTMGYGGDANGSSSDSWGAFWADLTDSHIKVRTRAGSYEVERVRVRIWVIQ